VLGVILLPPEFGGRYFINTSTEFVPDKENDTSFSGRLIRNQLVEISPVIVIN
jgi:hypothetical protein